MSGTGMGWRTRIIFNLLWKCGCARHFINFIFLLAVGSKLRIVLCTRGTTLLRKSSKFPKRTTTKAKTANTARYLKFASAIRIRVRFRVRIRVRVRVRVRAKVSLILTLTRRAWSPPASLARHCAQRCRRRWSTTRAVPATLCMNTAAGVHRSWRSWWR